MVARATIADVAREAGVSVATVDRVVNGRLPVREDTARRVLDAAHRLGFHAAGLIRSRLREQLPEVVVGVLLQRPDVPFYADLTARLTATITGSRLFRGVVRADFWSVDDAEDIAARLRRLGRRARAVAVVSPDHPAVAEAVADLAARDVAVFTLLSDLPTSARTSHIGIDGRKAGRTAAWVIHHTALRPGRVGVIVGSRRFQGHESREIGFRSYFRELAPGFRVLEAVVNSESDAATEEAVVQLVEAYPDLVGVYLAGGGIAGAVAGLRRVPEERRPALVGPELPPVARAALSERLLTAAVCEPIDRLCERLMELVVLSLEGEGARLPNHVTLPMDLFTPENL
ncbi:LacI family DNA-binding transcriptional regulator [Amaricoccus solimangrovi]|uniref:Substrate-binding domain-containing protein n=1 Tax=Amaricoccus solimangrovi TaxID=2589815 RepID=A0A501WQR1_9RHOB|nr:LacI family DNA-binding transcriptional regulator [Amaricoccus solimangrovi]TPE49597.1 substrate-binding domain-containing protein [Amaricoccus solimangrovi]